MAPSAMTCTYSGSIRRPARSYAAVRKRICVSTVYGSQRIKKLGTLSLTSRPVEDYWLSQIVLIDPVSGVDQVASALMERQQPPRGRR